MLRCAAWFVVCLTQAATLRAQGDRVKRPHPVKTRLSEVSTLGNSVLFSGGFTLSRHSDMNLDVGRSWVIANPLIFHSGTVGVGYSRTFTGTQDNYFKVFYEMTYAFIYIGVTARAELLSNERFDYYYVRPYAGLTMYSPFTTGIHLDLLYSYAVPLSGRENRFGHGVTLAMKIFLHEKRWYEYPFDKKHRQTWIHSHLEKEN